MGRAPLHQPDEFLDAARTVVLGEGIEAASVAAVARTSASPVGSLYHRFRSRDELLARLWLRAVRRSQAAFLAAVEAEPEPLEAAVAAALSVHRFARREHDDARLLAAYRREDFVKPTCSREVLDQLAGLNEPLRNGLEHLVRGLYGRVTARGRDRVLLATVDIPLGAIRRHLLAGTALPAGLRGHIEVAARAVLDTGFHEGATTS